MLRKQFAVMALLCAFIGSAFASQPGDDAQALFKAIASGDVEQIMSGYKGEAQLNWVGGPLDGTYTGLEQIRGAWTKFTKLQGKMDLRVGNVEESANPKGTTVIANLQIKGNVPIKVRYILLYRDGVLMSEIWQIDPNLELGS